MWIWALNPGKKPKRVWRATKKVRKIKVKRKTRKIKRIKVKTTARRIRRNDDLAKYIGVGLKENPRKGKKKIVVKRKRRVVKRKTAKKIKTVSTGASHMAKKRRKVSRKARKISRKARRSAPRRKAVRKVRKIRRSRKVRRNDWPKAAKGHKKASKKGWGKRRKPTKGYKKAKGLKTVFGRTLFPISKNDWSGQPKLHGKASRKGWGRRRRPTKGLKLAHGFIPGINRFPLAKNPFSRPLGLSRPAVRRHSTKGRSMGFGKILANPLKIARNIGGGALKPLMDKQNWIDASVIAGGSLVSTLGSVYLNAAIAKATGKDIPMTGITGIALKLATGAIGATAIGMKSPRHGKNFLYGAVAGIMADVIKTQVLPRIPFLNKTEPISDYLQTQGVSDYLTDGMGAYVAPSEIATAADDSQGSEF